MTPEIIIKGDGVSINRKQFDRILKYASRLRKMGFKCTITEFIVIGKFQNGMAMRLLFLNISKVLNKYFNKNTIDQNRS